MYVQELSILLIGGNYTSRITSVSVFSFIKLTGYRCHSVHIFSRIVQVVDKAAFFRKRKSSAPAKLCTMENKKLIT